LAAAERRWPSVDEAPWEDAPPVILESAARVGAYFTDCTSVLESQGPFLIERYRLIDFDHTAGQA